MPVVPPISEDETGETVGAVTSLAVNARVFTDDTASAPSFITT